MSENFKHLYEQMKKMVELYQDDIVPNLYKQLEQAKQPQWISCAERLPTEGVSIEMFFPISQTICLGYYRIIAKLAFWCINYPDGVGSVADEKPTHWRYRYITEAPQPPKGGRMMKEWININERLPNNGEEVFTLAKAKNIVGVDIYHEGHGFFPSNMYDNKVTHWIPIPKGDE